MSQESVVSTKINRYFEYITQLYIFYGISLFVPATSDGEYFTFLFGVENVVNPISWNILLVLAVVISILTVIKRVLLKHELLFMITGLFLISWNQILAVGDSAMNYGYSGFLLLTYPAISNLSLVRLRNSIIFSVLFLLVGIILTYFAINTGISLFPIKESRYFLLAEQFGLFNFINSSLYGQSNAAGAALTFCYIYLLILISNKRNFYLIILSFFLFLGILSTASVGSLLVSLAATSFLIIRFSGKYKPFLFFIIIIILAYAIHYFIEVSDSIGSGLIKWNRILAFFDFVFSNLNVFLIGYNYNIGQGAEQFYVESSFLDFWLNFGFLGISLLSLIFLNGIFVTLKSKDYFGGAMIALLFILILSQNSSLMPSNIIVFMTIYILLFRSSYKYRENKSNGYL